MERSSVTVADGRLLIVLVFGLLELILNLRLQYVENVLWLHILMNNALLCNVVKLL